MTIRFWSKDRYPYVDGLCALAHNVRNIEAWLYHVRTCGKRQHRNTIRTTNYTFCHNSSPCFSINAVVIGVRCRQRHFSQWNILSGCWFLLSLYFQLSISYNNHAIISVIRMLIVYTILLFKLCSTTSTPITSSFFTSTKSPTFYFIARRVSLYYPTNAFWLAI